MSVRHLRVPHHDAPVAHDDEAGEYTMRSNCPVFFANPGRNCRETITVYRGACIVRQTRQFMSGWSERMSVIYLYFPDREGKPDLWHIESSTRSMPSARRFIDRILATCNATPDEAPARTKNG